MAEEKRRDGAGRLQQLKPSASQALWGHLLQRNIPPTLRGATLSSASMVPVTPVDKNGTSMRMLLHDTQATLEKFSGHVDKLISRVDDAKREVATTHKIFQFGHEKLVEENVSLLNRCQTEIQKSLGKPAQAGSLEETRKAVLTVERTVESLSNRIDALQMLNQSQLHALQTIQEQHIQLLSAITPVLPLLQSIPLHIDTAKNDIKDVLYEGQIEYPRRTRPFQHGKRNHRESTPMSSSPGLDSSPRLKRGKLSNSSRHLHGDPGSSEGPTDLSGSTVNLASSPPPPSGYLESAIFQQSIPSSPTCNTRCQPSSLITSGFARTNPVRQSLPTCSTPANGLTSASAVRSGPPSPSGFSNAFPLPETGLDDRPQPLISSELQARSLFSDYDKALAENLSSSVVPFASSPGSSVALHASPSNSPVQPIEASTRLSSFGSMSSTGVAAEQSSSVTMHPTNGSVPRVPTCTPTTEQSAPAILTATFETSTFVDSTFASRDDGDISKINRPMSLKDRRARGLMIDPALRVGGKRYISFGDEDEEWD